MKVKINFQRKIANYLEMAEPEVAILSYCRNNIVENNAFSIVLTGKSYQANGHRLL